MTHFYDHLNFSDLTSVTGRGLVRVAECVRGAANCEAGMWGRSFGLRKLHAFQGLKVISRGLILCVRITLGISQ
jgi:hypothetical protein